MRNAGKSEGPSPVNQDYIFNKAPYLIPVILGELSELAPGLQVLGEATNKVDEVLVPRRVHQVIQGFINQLCVLSLRQRSTFE